MTYTLFFLPFMFKPVVQANISILISIDSQGLSFRVPNLYIHFCSFYIEIVFNCTVSGFMKIWTQKAAIYL